MASIDDTKDLSRDGSKEKLIEPESPKQSYGSNEQSQSSSNTEPKQQQQQQQEEIPQPGPSSPSVAADVDRIERLSDSSGPKTSQERSISPQVTIIQSSGGGTSDGGTSCQWPPKFNPSRWNFAAFVIGLVVFIIRPMVHSTDTAMYELMVLGLTIMACSIVSCLVPRGLWAKDLPDYGETKPRRHRHLSPDLPDDFPMEPRPDPSSPEEPSTERVHQVDVHHPHLPSSPSTSSAAKGVDPQGSQLQSKISSGGQEAAETPSSPSSKTEAPGSSFEESEQAIEKDAITKGATGYGNLDL